MLPWHRPAWLKPCNARLTTLVFHQVLFYSLVSLVGIHPLRRLPYGRMDPIFVLYGILIHLKCLTCISFIAQINILEPFETTYILLMHIHFTHFIRHASSGKPLHANLDAPLVFMLCWLYCFHPFLRYWLKQDWLLCFLFCLCLSKYDEAFC